MIDEKVKSYTYFVGIDISKNELDFAVLFGSKFLFHREIQNTVAEVKELVLELKQLPRFTISKAAFCMEQTGIYGNHLKKALRSFRANIIQEDALQIRSSLGNIRGKYDKLDAIRIAQYGFKNRDVLRIAKPRRKIIQQLAHLSTLRSRLIGVKLSLTQQLNEDEHFISNVILKQSKALCKNSTAAITKDIEAVNVYIRETIESDERVKRLFEVVISVPNIGPVTALQMIICSNEFLDISEPKKFACYAGVAPFKSESGIAQRKSKVSHLANRRMKALIHTCAINAARFDPEMKDYFSRKHLTEGKPKMAVINAIRSKLILRVYSCIKSDRFYEYRYRKKTLTQDTT